MQNLSIGSHVIFTDEHFKDSNALVTAIWASPNWKELSKEDSTYIPCINLVIVSYDEAKDDQYGRQIERRTSIVHKTSQPAGGFCWRLPNEDPPKMGTVTK